MLNELTPRRAALFVSIVALATILGAWLFQAWGYEPCPLCLEQRWAYYAAIPLAAVTALLARPGASYARPLLLLVGLIWVASAVFGAYHAGVEWKFWPGPTTCGGAIGGGLPDLTKPVISCDEAAIRILGLSLAGWNALISAALAAVSFLGARGQGSSSVSQ
jgi:disulfide bond formation protein DsbB